MTTISYFTTPACTTPLCYSYMMAPVMQPLALKRTCRFAKRSITTKHILKRKERSS